MNIKNIFQKICKELGGEYQLFFCNSLTPLQSEEFNLATMTPKVIGVGYVTGGNFIPIDGSIAEETRLYLEFGIPTTQTEQRLAEILRVIENNQAKYNVVEYDDNGVTKVATKYIMSFDYPTPTTGITPALGKMRQTFGLSVQIVSSETLGFGNASEVSVKIGNEYSQIANKIEARWTSTNEIIPRISIDGYKQTADQQYSSDRLIVSYYFKNDDPVHTLFENHRLHGQKAVYSLKYSQNGETEEFEAILVSYDHLNRIGAYQQVNCVFARATLESETQNMTLVLNAQAHSNIQVSRSGIVLGNGAILYVGDVLNIRATVESGYTITSLTANGKNLANVDTYVVTGQEANNQVVIADQVRSGSTETYLLSLTIGDGVNLSVTRGTEELTTNARLFNGDELVITATAQSGYSISSLLVNGESFTSGNTFVVSSNVSVVTTSSVQGYPISASKSVPEGEGATQVRLQVINVTDNQTIVDLNGNTLSETGLAKYGDKIKFVYTITNDRKLQKSSFLVNDTPIENGAEVICQGAMTCAFSTAYVPYHYQVTSGTGATSVSVSRGGEVIAPTTDIHIGDTLSITVNCGDDENENPYYARSCNVINNGVTDRYNASTKTQSFTFSGVVVNGDITITPNICGILSILNFVGSEVQEVELAYGSAYTFTRATSGTKSGDVFKVIGTGGIEEYKEVGETYVGGSVELMPLTNIFMIPMLYDVDNISMVAHYKTVASYTLATNEDEISLATLDEQIFVKGSVVGSSTIDLNDSVVSGASSSTLKTLSTQSLASATCDYVGDVAWSAGTQRKFISGDNCYLATEPILAFYLNSFQGTHTSIQVTKDGQSVVEGGTPLYKNDTISIILSKDTGYELTSTIEGATLISGTNYRVDGNVTITTTAQRKTYQVSVSIDGGCDEVSIYDGTRYYYDGDEILGGTVVSIQARTESGYYLSYIQVNNDFVSLATSEITSLTYSNSFAIDSNLDITLRSCSVLKFKDFSGNVISHLTKYPAYNTSTALPTASFTPRTVGAWKYNSTIIEVSDSYSGISRTFTPIATVYILLLAELSSSEILLSMTSNYINATRASQITSSNRANVATTIYGHGSFGGSYGFPNSTSSTDVAKCKISAGQAIQGTANTYGGSYTKSAYLEYIGDSAWSSGTQSSFSDGTYLYKIGNTIWE